jgi:predicted Zn-dependent protease
MRGSTPDTWENRNPTNLVHEARIRYAKAKTACARKEFYTVHLHGRILPLFARRFKAGLLRFSLPSNVRHQLRREAPSADCHC